MEVTLARGTGGSDLERVVAAFSYSGANRLQWPHLSKTQFKWWTKKLLHSSNHKTYILNKSIKQLKTFKSRIVHVVKLCYLNYTFQANQGEDDKLLEFSVQSAAQACFKDAAAWSSQAECMRACYVMSRQTALKQCYCKHDSTHCSLGDILPTAWVYKWRIPNHSSIIDNIQQQLPISSPVTQTYITWFPSNMMVNAWSKYYY